MIFTSWIEQLREESNAEYHYEDGWLRHYFLGIYSSIPLNHQQWIMRQLAHTNMSEPFWFTEYRRLGLVTDQETIETEKIYNHRSRYYLS